MIYTNLCNTKHCLSNANNSLNTKRLLLITFKKHNKQVAFFSSFFYKFYEQKWTEFEPDEKFDPIWRLRVLEPHLDHTDIGRHQRQPGWWTTLSTHDDHRPWPPHQRLLIIICFLLLQGQSKNYLGGKKEPWSFFCISE